MLVHKPLAEVAIDYAPSLFALSILIAIQGAFVALVLAGRLRGSIGTARYLRLLAAAVTLAVSIWSMHFIGMLATRMPGTVSYLPWPTALSFLVAMLAVIGAIALVATAPLSTAAFTGGALLMGTGIVGMHFLGMAALTACFALSYDPLYVATSYLVGVTASGLGLHLAFRIDAGRIDAGRIDVGPRPPVVAAILIGLAISGMHYTAMEGTTLRGPICAASAGGLSPGSLAVLVVVLATTSALGFLLTLAPQRAGNRAGALPPITDDPPAPADTPDVDLTPRPLPVPEPRRARALPAERDGRTLYIDVAAVRAVHANGHYTLLTEADGDILCPLSFSAVEAQLDPQRFIRVHRSHLVAIDAVASVERWRDGGLARLDGVAAPVPVSRARYQPLLTRMAVWAKGQRS